MSIEERVAGQHYATGYNGVGSNLTSLTRANISPGTPNHIVINDGAGLFSSVAALPVSNGGTGLTSTVADSVFVTDALGAPSWSTTLPAGISMSHGDLSGLSADDHSQYLLLAGRAGGQTIKGGTAAGEDLHIMATADPTQGKIIMDADVEADVIDHPGTISIGTATVTGIEIARPGITTDINSDLVVQGSIDTNGISPMYIGASSASSIEIAQSTVTTYVNGELRINGAIDAIGGSPLYFGTNSSEVNLGQLGTPTIVHGNLQVLGTTTSIDSTVVNVTDNFLNLNIGYTNSAISVPGGLVVNYLPTATASVITSFASATNTATSVTVFAAGDIIQISGANNVENDGIFVVASHVANVLTISTTNYGWNQTAFTTDLTLNAASATKVNVSIVRANVSGDWEVGKGNTAPVSFSTLATASNTWSFSPAPGSWLASSANYSVIGDFAFDFSRYGSATSFVCTFYLTYSNRTLDIIVHDGTSAIGSLLGVATTGIHSFAVTVPGADKHLTIQIRKSSGGGISPEVNSVQFDLST